VVVARLSTCRRERAPGKPLEKGVTEAQDIPRASGSRPADRSPAGPSAASFLSARCVEPIEISAFLPVAQHFWHRLGKRFLSNSSRDPACQTERSFRSSSRPSSLLRLPDFRPLTRVPAC
jgi:hypothetical protein